MTYAGYGTTFVNQNLENNIIEQGREHLASTLEAIQFWMEHGTDLDGYEYAEHTRRELLEEFGGDREQVREVEGIIEEFKSGCGDFHDYGLCFDFVEATEEHGAYYQYQISWGGPSDEIRFHYNGDIEYVFLDWFCGVGFNLTYSEEGQWIKGFFSDCGMIDFDSKEPEELERLDYDDCEEE